MQFYINILGVLAATKAPGEFPVVGAASVGKAAGEEHHHDTGGS